MSKQIELTTNYINALSPLAITTDKTIGEHVVNKFMAMYQVPKQEALAFWEREKDNFMKRINDSEDLKACTPMSTFMALMQVFGWGLSFEGGEQMEVYLISGNRNVAPKGQPQQWIKEVKAEPSPYGKKKIRIQNGQIKDTSKPQIVYEGDFYEEDLDENGKLRVKWKKGDRGENPKIKGSFIRIERPDGTHEFITFDLIDVQSWKKASEKKNAKWDDNLKKRVPGKANALYTSNDGQIDKLFFEGKTLTHAFKGYPKVISVPKLPESFIPDEEPAMRQGLDVSEFTEDVEHTEVDEQVDEFEKELEAESQKEPEKTVVIQPNIDDDEPEF